MAMLSAKRLIKVGLSCLGVAVVSFALIAFGIDALRPLIFIAVFCGACTVFIGLVAKAGGFLKNDLDE